MFRVTIRTDGAAFRATVPGGQISQTMVGNWCDQVERDYELARLLRGIAKLIEDGNTDFSERQPLYDTNGQPVGFARYW